MLVRTLRPIGRAGKRGGAVMNCKMVLTAIAGCVVAALVVVRTHLMTICMAMIAAGEMMDLIVSGRLISILGFVAAIIGLLVNLYNSHKAGDRGALLQTIADQRVQIGEQKQMLDDMRALIAETRRSLEGKINAAAADRAAIELQVTQLGAEYLREHGELMPSGKVFQLRKFTKPPEDTRVLVVEDHTPTRVAMEKLLLHYGFLVATAADVTEAIERLRHGGRSERTPFDFVLLDLKFPGTGQGVDLLKAVHEIAPACRCIVISGVADDGAVAEAGRNGAVAVLTKPVDKAKLFELMGLKEEPE